jgi:thioesterase domain-containing protein
VTRASERAFQNYTPEIHATPVVLFRCKIPNRSVVSKTRNEPDHGWKQWLRGPLTVHTVDCEHLELLKEPILSDLRAELARSIGTAAWRGPSKLGPYPLRSI